MNPRWKNRPEGSTWGDWGPDDQLGRLNLVGPEQVLQAVAEVKTGKTFCLSLPLDYPGGNVLNPYRFPPRLQPVLRDGSPYYNYPWSNVAPKVTDIASDDAVLLYTQYSTQWDSLAHRGSQFDVDGDGQPESVYYNGFRASEHVVLDDDNTPSAQALGVENMAEHGVQGRGVMVNLRDHFGETRQEVGYAQLASVFEKDKIVVEPGDIVCLWTGLDKKILGMGRKPDSSLLESCAVLDGRDERLLNWITESGVAALVSDNLAIEATRKPLPPGHTGSSLPLHELCLFKLGVHLGELWLLGELAEWLKDHKRYRFLLTAPPLRLTGAVGSPVSPIATV